MDTLTPDEAATLAGVPAEQLKRWAWDGVGPKNRGTRRKPRYDERDVQEWRQKHMQGPPKPVVVEYSGGRSVLNLEPNV